MPTLPFRGRPSSSRGGRPLAVRCSRVHVPMHCCAVPHTPSLSPRENSISVQSHSCAQAAVCGAGSAATLRLSWPTCHRELQGPSHRTRKLRGGRTAKVPHCGWTCSKSPASGLAVSLQRTRGITRLSTPGPSRRTSKLRCGRTARCQAGPREHARSHFRLRPLC